MKRSFDIFCLVSLTLLIASQSSYSQEPGRPTELTKLDPAVFKYYSSSRIIELPIIIQCGLDKSPSSISPPDSLSDKEELIHTMFYGRIWPDRNYLTFLLGAIGDLIYPRIVTYKIDGTPIDELFYMPYCGGTGGPSTIESVMIISKNHTVTICDTLESMRVNSQNKEIPGSEKVDISTRIFRFDKNGRFVRTKKYSQTIKAKRK
jgi:hypothetical protein